MNRSTFECHHFYGFQLLVISQTWAPQGHPFGCFVLSSHIQSRSKVHPAGGHEPWNPSKGISWRMPRKADPLSHPHVLPTGSSSFCLLHVSLYLFAAFFHCSPSNHGQATRAKMFLLTLHDTWTTPSPVARKHPPEFVKFMTCVASAAQLAFEQPMAASSVFCDGSLAVVAGHHFLSAPWCSEDSAAHYIGSRPFSASVHLIQLFLNIWSYHHQGYLHRSLHCDQPLASEP